MTHLIFRLREQDNDLAQRIGSALNRGEPGGYAHEEGTGRRIAFCHWSQERGLTAPDGYTQDDIILCCHPALAREAGVHNAVGDWTGTTYLCIRYARGHWYAYIRPVGENDDWFSLIYSM